MSKLVSDFNKQYLKFFCILQRSFEDNEDIKKEVKFIQDSNIKDPFNVKIAELYADDYRDVIDQVKLQDASCLEKMDCLKRIHISDLWAQLQESEKPHVWKSIRSLGHFALTISTCGEDMLEMENITKKFAAEYKDDPEIELKLFQKMLEGGEYSKQMSKLFSSKKRMRNMFNNVGTILKSSGGGSSNIADMMDMSGLFDNDSFDKIHEGVQSVFGNDDQESEESGVSKEDISKSLAASVSELSVSEKKTTDKKKKEEASAKEASLPPLEETKKE